MEPTVGTLKTIGRAFWYAFALALTIAAVAAQAWALGWFVYEFELWRWPVIEETTLSLIEDIGWAAFYLAQIASACLLLSLPLLALDWVMRKLAAAREARESERMREEGLRIRKRLLSDE